MIGKDDGSVCGRGQKRKQTNNDYAVDNNYYNTYLKIAMHH